MSVKEQKKNEVRQVQNKKYRTLRKNQLKKINNYFEKGEKNEDELEKLFRKVQKVLDTSSQKKVIHKNRVAGEKSKLRKKINELKKEKFLKS